jgi:glyoxylase-like metal-dependent hydrolase (beta-lactamase superfamily II)
MKNRTSQLTWDVYVAPPVPTVTDDLPPGTERRLWSPISATLISGERDAVLVDALMTADQAKALGDWVAATGKNLTAIYITHGHGDHFFGVGHLLKRFPSARALAVPAVVEHMRRQMAPQFLAAFWNLRLPGQIPDDLTAAEPLTNGVIDLEGHDLAVVELGHTDTDNTTCLHVPSIGLVVAGDAAYNDVHLFLAESSDQGRRSWIAALDTIGSLQPRAVIAGHQRVGRHDGPEIVEETRQYIRDFDRVVNAAETARELYDRMLALYPDRINPGALWTSARALKPAALAAQKGDKS